MINFFRKTRKKMANDNRPIKYMRYAIGEIALVVIGILIALQINNWNELRKSNIEERKALDNIQRDFIKNREVLTNVMNETQKILDAGIEILNHTGNKERPANQNIFNAWLNEMYNSEPYYPQNGFLDDLLSSGRLGIFKNQELRNLLSSWKPKVEILNERFNTLSKNEGILNAYILESASWLNADEVATGNRNVKFPVSGFDVDNRILLDKLLFENQVENLVISADSYYTFQIATLKLLDEIIIVLEKEVANDHD